MQVLELLDGFHFENQCPVTNTSRYRKKSCHSFMHANDEPSSPPVSRIEMVVHNTIVANSRFFVVSVFITTPTKTYGLYKVTEEESVNHM
ncbi:hypothetical protein H310_09380 [Aphanomyces invadans]|uniref:Uncharacterized protein n=1 Tax=Aphanomyces invadans TaxID=157072 RepID=A0A024TTZ8_9STRA|nr:hypothetical protein H310_09380 [Aphanomyces invadans]ETV97449.1 hypothetical protein H310_09380 [Aphanomyces invadans]|eukprot:XP_008873658.1 hypothetical protein H310_09380 [Aphanomyces invadans]